MENTITVAAEQIDHKATDDERKILSRLILQKVLSADAIRFMSPESKSTLTKAFLSASPDQDMTFNFRDPDRSGYEGGICSFSMGWKRSAAEINDLTGNVWATYETMILGGISSAYSQIFSSLTQRFECISLVSDLINDIRALVPNPIRVMFLDNDGREARDKKAKHDATIARLKDAFDVGRLRSYRIGLRVGGNGKAIHAESLRDIIQERGLYTFEIREGSKRRPVFKRYSINFREGGTYGVVRRLA